MVAHSGFITVARKIEPGHWRTAHPALSADREDGDEDQKDPEDREGSCG